MSDSFDHSQMVKVLVKDPELIRLSLTTSDVNLIHAQLGISDESGELCGAIKKHVIYRRELDRQNVIEELGDLEFYLEQLRQELNITRTEVLKYNMEKLSERYANYKYSDAAAAARADKTKSGETT